ncbi:tol-pal system-associated acyl-CoA thioesterase [Psychrosphaera sp. B3R10]|uniref:Tol-pal system-associated acyl-CoA thioesterase n=1 Tax=Psychrosphaera algicola TaxID=3023714 RepID=A0ABT5FIB5_9GAMM|nr:MULTISPECIES: tol-pal system-associated acyl-CoA thioesterase [unclassified Psychrosphaera]MBU2881649.1 tol-pal system-associated acyl-CoA thioesterase [Psychrosphaera sp. I2R16]MBU2991096.1 tol-pal system-associated acyl-CoA thioesterase [Psychrosphaera sp. B3R10]MDC2890927.1 tol-pal system-associated acyl-CoA thioesterase [Psychrosphaera sp. G1-22]MDO6721449.1 tol-pal system-associated acyl-CoA thioesterase [Psychrosphaera sp. 1_MG-2023]
MFKLPIRIYYEDTDAGGIVYHANYLKFCERGRTEYLRHLGIEQDEYLKQNIAFVVKSMQIDFKVAAKFNDEVVVLTEIKQIKRASVEFIQTIINNKEQSVFTADVQVACIDLTKMKPKAIPSDILEVLESAS